MGIGLHNLRDANVLFLHDVDSVCNKKYKINKKTMIKISILKQMGGTMRFVILGKKFFHTQPIDNTK